MKLIDRVVGLIKSKNVNEEEGKSVKVYYQTVTPESAEQGDFAETGEHDERMIDPNDSESAVEQALGWIKEYGYLEASSGPGFEQGIWYTTIDPDEDYTTGEETYYTIHLNGFTEEEEKQIYNKLSNKNERLDVGIVESESLSSEEFVEAINKLRLSNKNKWYTWSGVVNDKKVSLKAYNTWLQIFKVDGVNHSGLMDISISAFKDALKKAVV